MRLLRSVEPDADAELLHGWVTQPYARFWDMQQASVADVRAAYAEIDASPHHEACLGYDDGAPVFLCEHYDPAHSPLADVYDVHPGDVGMHFLVAPPTDHVPGFTRRVIRTVMAHCFRSPTARRVVVEPDARNDKVHRLNATVGFVVDREVQLPGKRALLSFCTRDAYERSQA